LRELIEAKMKGLPIKPRAVSAPAPVIDLMSALKRSLAQETLAATGARAGKQKRTKTVPDRRQPSLHLPVSGGRKRKDEPAAEPTQHRHKAAQEGLGAAIDLSLTLGSLAGSAPCLVRDRLFSHFVLNSSAPQSFGHSGQLGCPDSELFDNFWLDRSILQISTSPCQPQKMAFVAH
jgi:hypothetical protein